MIDDDEIAERIAKHIRAVLSRPDIGFWEHDDIVNFMTDAESYRLAFIGDVRERAKARRQAGRVRRLVFAKLGVADRAAVGK